MQKKKKKKETFVLELEGEKMLSREESIFPEVICGELAGLCKVQFHLWM